MAYLSNPPPSTIVQIEINRDIKRTIFPPPYAGSAMTLGSVLITGGTGYIGSHTAIALLQMGFEVILLDNLSNSSLAALDRIQAICGIKPTFYDADVTDQAAVEHVFARHPHIDGVIHFAALKAVGASGSIPLEYYRTNLVGTLTLIQVLLKYKVCNLVFSSSAAVYGEVDPSRAARLSEDLPCCPWSPYGTTKLLCEIALKDVATSRGPPPENAECRLNVAVLRYFNPAGNHPSGLLGEEPHDGTSSLLSLICQVAQGNRESVEIFGTDYDTRDGTAVRDYIHVVDVAEAHIAALDYLQRKEVGFRIWNIGSGVGTTVREAIEAFGGHIGSSLPSVIGPRRAGDVSSSVCNATRAKHELGWRTRRSLKEACGDLWKWRNRDNAQQGCENSG